MRSAALWTIGLELMLLNIVLTLGFNSLIEAVSK